LNNKKLEDLYDIAAESHARIQQDFEDINPMVGVNNKMREMGVPADVMTIDCLKSGKRIILILHDQQPDIVSYQFSFKDKDPDEKFENIQFSQLSADKLYDWIKCYFQ
jgi:hypothetical protein